MSVQDPITLYYWPTPNGWKVAIALYEMGLPFKVEFIDIGKGDQFSPAFTKVSPNQKMPAILDPQGPDGAPISVFESGAILQYLARKTGQFYGSSRREEIEIDQWLMWQMGGVGPMAGQTHHFWKYAPEDLPYAKERYRKETARLYAVLDARLSDGRDYICGACSIADMAVYPWACLWEGQQQSLEDKPHMAAWLERCAARPGFHQGRALSIEKRG